MMMLGSFIGDQVVVIYSFIGDQAEAAVPRARGRLPKAEAAVPWAEAGGFMARRRPRDRNGLPFGLAIQA